MTAIEWTDVTWNPTTGCDRVSPGCDHCYALTMAKRLKAMGSEKYQRDGDPKTSGPGFGVSTHEDALALPFSWRKPRKVFVNSMSDLFHKDVPDEFIAKVFAVMAATPQHTYQILTKRHARMRSLVGRSRRDDFLSESFADEVMRLLPQPFTYDQRIKDPAYAEQHERNRRAGVTEYVRVAPAWPLPNVWLGVSVENQHWADIRIPALLDTPAAVRFLSCEPLLGPVDLRRWLWTGYEIRTDYGTGVEYDAHPSDEIDWVIAGGESGHGARPMSPHWATELADQCSAAGVPFLFKQHGAWIGSVRPSDPWYGRKPDAWVNHDDGRVVTNDAEVVDGWWTGVYRVGKKAAGREIYGRTWDQYPAGVR